MELYNSLIQDTLEILKSGSSKAWDFSASDAWDDICSSELVLQRDAAFELGARGKGSANYVLFTSKPDLIPEDQILLYGPDISELKTDCDFARITLLRVGLIDGDDEVLYRTLKDIEFAKYHVFPEGYMVRMSPESFREQIRVSKNAVKKGINFKAVGADYLKAYKANSNVVAASVIFITDPAFDFSSLQKIAKKASAVTDTLTHIFEGFSTDCSVCALKDVCDEIEGMKELHFGVGDKGKK